MPADDDLAATLASVAAVLATETDVLRLLQRVCDLAVDAIDACDQALRLAPDPEGAGLLERLRDELPRALPAA